MFLFLKHSEMLHVHFTAVNHNLCYNTCHYTGLGSECEPTQEQQDFSLIPRNLVAMSPGSPLMSMGREPGNEARNLVGDYMVAP